MGELGIRDHAILLLSLATGARPNEIRQLRYPDDVDLGDGVIRIREVTSKTAAGHRRSRSTPRFVAALDEYVKDYRPEVEGALFPNKRGNPFTYWGFRQVHYRLRDRLRAKGPKGYQSYRNRHTGITNFARTPGFTLADTQQLAGHADAVTTRKYMAARTIAQLRRLPSSFTHAYGRVS